MDDVFLSPSSFRSFTTLQKQQKRQPKHTVPFGCFFLKQSFWTD
jgi:hypothetical protein